MGLSTTYRRLAPVLLAAALLAPSVKAMPYIEVGESFSQAASSPDNRAGLRGIGDPGFQIDRSYQRALAIRGQALNNLYAAQAASSPDNRAGVRSPGASPAQTPVTHSLRPDDRQGVRGVGVTQVSAGDTSSFDWGNVGIGALSVAGLAFLGGGMLVALHARQRRQDGVAVL